MAAQRKNIINDDKNDTRYCGKKSLFHRGIIVDRKIASTLQGSIYRGKYNDNDGITYDVVIKRAEIKLSKKGVGKIGPNKYKFVDENIIKEARLMNHIQNGKNVPKGILKMHKFINDGHNYFIIMDYGGKSLFDHVILCHKLIQNGQLNIKEWSEHVRIIFKQMCIILNYLHNKVHCCHLDISLENFLIKGFELKNGKIISHGQVYICDWGLGEYFGKNSQFKCTKFAGKIKYCSPEIISNKIHDGRLSDSWSLGITLFMMQFGVEPMLIANNTDRHYINIINGHLQRMIIHNGKAKFIINKYILSILSQILTLQQSRLHIHNILQHPYIKQ